MPGKGAAEPASANSEHGDNAEELGKNPSETSSALRRTMQVGVAPCKKRKPVAVEVPEADFHLHPLAPGTAQQAGGKRSRRMSSPHEVSWLFEPCPVRTGGFLFNFQISSSPVADTSIPLYPRSNRSLNHHNSTKTSNRQPRLPPCPPCASTPASPSPWTRRPRSISSPRASTTAPVGPPHRFSQPNTVAGMLRRRIPSPYVPRPRRVRS